MNVSFTENAWEDYLYWQKMDKKFVKRINELIKDIKRNPFEGLGKPEPLKYDLAGKWSRRITDEHRLVYQVEGNNLIVYTCRYHYWDIYERVKKRWRKSEGLKKHPFLHIPLRRERRFVGDSNFCVSAKFITIPSGVNAIFQRENWQGSGIEAARLGYQTGVPF